MAKPSTKERILSASCAIFAEKGYRDTTVAEICDKAEANIAAVNYHFGDKESLYNEVWRHAFRIAAEVYPMEGKLTENPTIEDHLYNYARAILRRIFSEDETGHFAKLLCHEMVKPTLALEKIAEEALFPQKQHLRNLVAGYMGASVDASVLQLCLRSIIGQCAFYNFSRGLRESMLGTKLPDEQEIDRIAYHIARFSVGGIKEMRT